MKKDNNLNEQDLITIIVSIYNGEQYLRECIESIINQDYEKLEIILVNDGSNDNSLGIINEYKKKDNRIIIINKKNSGVSISRNNAIDIAKGKYICFIDQDDIISKNYVSYYYYLIKKNNCEIATTPQPLKFFGDIKENKKIKDEVSVITGEEATINMLYHKFVIAPWNKMISKDLIDKYNIRFEPTFFCGEGFAFSIECFVNAKMVALGNKKVYYYRIGDPNTGASKYSEYTINSSIKAQMYIKDLLKTEKEKNAWYFSNWHTYCDCFNIMVGCKAKDKNPDLYLKLKDYCKRNAFVANKAPIVFQQKLRGVMFNINPYLAAKIINKFRIRKFKKVAD